MSKCRPSSRPSRCKRIGGWVFAAAASLATVLVVPEAGATELESPGETTTEFVEEPELGNTVFGVPRLSRNMAPPLQLQPERARLMLLLPSEWMPAPDYGRHGRLGMLGGLGMPLDPHKRWVFQRDQRRTQATIGTSLRLRVTDPEHSIEFRLRLMPRAAIAVLHFDPTAGLH